MSEQNLVKSKKSSRLNAKKEDKQEIVIDRSWVAVNMDIIVNYEERMSDPPKVIKNAVLYRNQYDELVGHFLADYLKNLDLIKDESSLSFYDPQKKTYVYGFLVNKDVREISKNVNQRFVYNNSINVKVRLKRKLIVESLIEEQRFKYEESQDPNNKVTKEKKIGEVVEKVALWRKFYTGFYDEFGNYIQKPLQTAAQEVGIAKKTLDDYLLQIRNGKKYGFNFNEKVNAKIGELRAFVRDEKKKQSSR